MPSKKKIKGDGNIVHASFDGKSKPTFAKLDLDLKNTKDLVLLSIKGNEYCSGEYLGAIVEQAIATHGFTTFLVADEVYWHNLKPSNFTPDQERKLKREALNLGEQYLETNLKHFLSPFKIELEDFNRAHENKTIREKINIINQMAADRSLNFEIIDWHEWVTQKKPEFQVHKAEITSLYQSNPVLRRSIKETADKFAQRHKVEGGAELWTLRSTGYLTEESPAVIWIAASLGYHFIVYPGEMIKPFKATKEYFVVSTNAADANPGNPIYIHVANPELLVNWLEANFKRSKLPGIDLDSSSISYEEEVKSTTKDYAFFSAIQNQEATREVRQETRSESHIGELSEIIKGVTMGIYSLPIDENSKLDLLLSFLHKFQYQLSSEERFTTKPRIS